MDLVKSYASDMDGDSDIEEIPLAVDPPNNPAEEIDVIDLDSDSTDENITENEEKNDNLNASEIDCIDLELSESTEKDSPLKKTPIDSDLSVKDSAVKTTSEVPSSVPSTSPKKIDYFDLEDSESDNECESKERNISTLMDTASLLNDTPYGPQKQSDGPNITDSISENMHVTRLIDKIKTSNSFTDSNSSRNTPELKENCALSDSADSSLLDACDKESTEGFPLEDNNVSENVSCIFREEDRVIEASQKIIVSRIPHQIIQTHNAHSNLITSLSWCIPKFCYLFLSASQDGSIKIWDLYRTHSVQCIKVNSGLNAAKWSLDGGQIITGGFEKKAFVYDVQTGNKIVEYDIYNLVTCIECHPYMEDVFLVGTKNAVLGYDIRVDTLFPIRTFFSKCEEILDMAFLDENEFICSTNIVSHDSADRTIMAWDFASGARLSNQIYLERYTCPSLKVHPSDSTFIAQTNGNYIAAFSTNRPYRMKDKRYLGHKVSGHGIECDISPDGKYAVSGDVEGSLYFYNYSTTSTILVTPKQNVPTNRVKWNPVLSSTLVSSTYDGQIQVWK